MPEAQLTMRRMRGERSTGAGGPAVMKGQRQREHL